MSKQAILFSIGAVVVLGLVAAGNAQPGDGPRGERGRPGGHDDRGHRGGPPAPEELFREIDADGDGMISEEEFMQHHEERFGGRGPGGPPEMGPPHEGRGHGPRGGERSEFDRPRGDRANGDRRGGGEFGPPPHEMRGPMGPPPRHDHYAQFGPPPHEMRGPMGPPPRGEFRSERGRGPRHGQAAGRGGEPGDGCRCDEQGPSRHHRRSGDDRGGYERGGRDGHRHGPPPRHGEGRGPRGERSRPELEPETDDDTSSQVPTPADAAPAASDDNAV